MKREHLIAGAILGAECVVLGILLRDDPKCGEACQMFASRLTRAGMRLMGGLFSA